jgi:hypothetical protein
MKELSRHTNPSEGKKPVEVAIQLGLSEKEATRYYTAYWRLNFTIAFDTHGNLLTLSFLLISYVHYQY